MRDAEVRCAYPGRVVSLLRSPPDETNEHRACLPARFRRMLVDRRRNGWARGMYPGRPARRDVLRCRRSAAGTGSGGLFSPVLPDCAARANAGRRGLSCDSAVHCRHSRSRSRVREVPAGASALVSQFPSTWHRCRTQASPTGIDPQPRVPRQHVEIAVAVKHCRAGADGNRADEAVDQLANGLSLAAAGTIQGGRLVVVGRMGRGEGSCARAIREGFSGGVRSGHRRAPPFGWDRRRRFRSPSAPRHGCRPWTQCREGIRSTPRCRPGSPRAPGTHLIEVAIPARSPKSSGLVEPERLGRHHAQCEIDSFAFRREPVATHDFGASLVVDVDVGACHVYRIHQKGDENQARGSQGVALCVNDSIEAARRESIRRPYTASIRGRPSRHADRGRPRARSLRLRPQVPDRPPNPRQALRNSVQRFTR